MPPLLELLSTAAGTNAAQTAIATSRPNAAGDDYDAVDNEKRILTLLNAIRMARQSRISRMRGAAPKWEPGPGMGHGQRPRDATNTFIDSLRRTSASRRGPKFTRHCTPGSAARQGGPFFTALDLGDWSLASGFSIAAASLRRPALHLLHCSQTHRNPASHLPAG
ncbi:hypothetical protein CCMA1212_002896 [Trichoderma ghanense]|uniref:Uncharacterized protein n=1 Tax=Trichoderma ghanense TaxID=65468 RepID=A0ABY2HCW9_9HYPO